MASTPIFDGEQAITRLRETVHGKAANFYAMYSSILGGIVNDPALMVLPLDDHMVHRGHGVFDTATLTHGMLYQLDPHLDRLIRSAQEHVFPCRFFARNYVRSFSTLPRQAASAMDRFATGSPPVPAAMASVQQNVFAVVFT